MSTRWVIGRGIAGGDAWEGRYVHSDGYPTYAGEQVWGLVKRLGVEGFIESVIEAHPAGWSYLDAREEQGGACYCHNQGEGTAEQWWVRSDDRRSWCEWAYILNPERRTLLVFKSYLIGRAEVSRLHFALAPGDDPYETHWAYVGTFELDGDEPNWEQVEKDGYGQANVAKIKKLHERGVEGY